MFAPALAGALHGLKEMGRSPFRFSFSVMNQPAKLKAAENKVSRVRQHFLSHLRPRQHPGNGSRPDHR
jgi:hypothetical protein